MPLIRVTLLIEASSSVITGRRIEGALRGAVAALGGGVLEVAMRSAPPSAEEDARRARAPTRRMAPVKGPFST